MLGFTQFVALTQFVAERTRQAGEYGTFVPVELRDAAWRKRVRVIVEAAPAGHGVLVGIDGLLAEQKKDPRA